MAFRFVATLNSAVVIAVLLAASSTHAAFDIGFGDDSDLTHFVSRPDIKAPLFTVDTFDAHSVVPGYWFVAPYAMISQQSQARNYYQPCQTGPHIYDGNGELVWSGACLVRNQNACDFRAFVQNGSYYLSTILYVYGNDTKGHGAILDSAYNIVEEVHVPTTITNFNMHELNVIDGGRRALHIESRPRYVDVTELGIDGVNAGWVADLGFRETEVSTGRTTFEWWAADHVSLSESSVSYSAQDLRGPPPMAWNWFHGNSVEKSSEGDYLFSSRFTDCIYKISGKNGSILWRLGGKKSSFSQDFNFSKQHDARWRINGHGTTEVVSFLDNAADSYNQTATASSALIVELDTQAMTARVVNRWTRPDGKLSRLRGNFQPLPNGNAFVGWSDNSERFVTYRAWKSNFTAHPTEPPVMKASVYGKPANSVLVCHVSWNGATEVTRWNFYGVGNDNNTSDAVLLGGTPRTGFETVFHWPGFTSSVYAEALDRDGVVLGTSLPNTVELPRVWETSTTASGRQTLARYAQPDDFGVDDDAGTVKGEVSWDKTEL